MWKLGSVFLWEMVWEVMFWLLWHDVRYGEKSFTRGQVQSVHQNLPLKCILSLCRPNSLWHSTICWTEVLCIWNTEELLAWWHWTIHCRKAGMWGCCWSVWANCYLPSWCRSATNAGKVSTSWTQVPFSVWEERCSGGEGDP